MSIDLRLKLINYTFIALIALVAIILAGIAFGAMTLSEADRWVSHTQGMEKRLRDVRIDYESALYLGRRKMVGETISDEELAAARAAAQGKVTILKESIRDNAIQIGAADYLAQVMAQRFKVQDEQFASMKRDAATGLIYFPESTVSKSINTEYLVATTLIQMRSAEAQLLTVERYPRLIYWQWKLTYFAVFIVALFFVLLGALIYFHRQTLERMSMIGHKFDETLKDSSMEINGNFRAQVEKLHQAIMDDAVSLQ